MKIENFYCFNFFSLIVAWLEIIAIFKMSYITNVSNIIYFLIFLNKNKKID